MEKIRTILVDDEPGNLITLSEILKTYCTEVSVIGKAEDIRKAEELIRREKPDLIFLDIEMPYGSGFDLLEKLRPFDFEVIFVTAFDNYAIKAFKYAALDYILKPVNIGELQQSVQKVRARAAERNISNRVDLLISSLNVNRADPKKIALPTTDGLRFESLDQIIYLEANANYTFVYLSGGQKHVVSKTLGDFEVILPPTNFCRVHNSYIINIDKVSQYHKGRGGYVIMQNGTSIEVSARRKENFLSRFGP